MAALISVIVPNRDGEEVIGACLDSLLGQELPAHEIIMVDDGSRDRSRELIRAAGSRVRLIVLDSSLGFAGACGQGLAAATGEWIALLNSDAVAHPAWLLALAQAVELDPRIGMAASRVLLEHPPGQVDSLGIGFTRGGLAFLPGRGDWDAPDEALPETTEVFGPAGAAAMYRRSLIEQTGFFEPDFFAFYEDLDLAFRARWRGFKCVLANRARVVHKHSYTVTRTRTDKRYLLQRNRLRTVVRNWPAGWIARYSPWLTAAGLGGLAVALGEGKGVAALRARRDAVGFLARDLARRQETLGAMAVSAREMQGWIGR